MKKKSFISLVSLFTSISMSFAAVASAEDLFQNIVRAIFQPLLQLIIVIAVLYFLFGGLKFILAAREGNQENMNNGKRHLFWGTIGLFIVFSIGGILRVLNTMFGGMF